MPLSNLLIIGYIWIITYGILRTLQNFPFKYHIDAQLYKYLHKSSIHKYVYSLDGYVIIFSPTEANSTNLVSKHNT
jgi:hypothetical protein